MESVPWNLGSFARTGDTAGCVVFDAIAAAGFGLVDEGRRSAARFTLPPVLRAGSAFSTTPLVFTARRRGGTGAATGVPRGGRPAPTPTASGASITADVAVSGAAGIPVENSAD